MKRVEIKSGDKYGRLTIVKEVEPDIEPSGRKYRKFNCLCECGNEKNIVLKSIRKGVTTSCGCYKIEKTTTHGLWKNSLYETWNGIKQRCYNSKHKRYKDYGGRGIKVCDRWLTSFQNFLEDMGERPKGTSIDRINNDGNYEPSNCRWATSKEQAINRRPKEYYGEKR